MTFSDDILMAYADGELAEPQRSQVDAAVRADPELAAIVERHRALRARVFDAFAGVLEEPVPARLDAAAASKVLSLDAARNARTRAAATPAPAAAPVRQPVWPRWGALAATLVLGVLAGSLWFKDDGGGFVGADGGGRLVARGQLAGALSRQLASDPAPNSPVRIGVSFATRDGGYCRSFSVGASAGLACREGETWRIPVLSDKAASGGAYRQAASTAPEAVLDAIDERIAGTTMNAAAERAARERGWRR
ncbi:anti-sigma factor family protein [Massilia litorea]|uniref:Anti-sigma factor n=1 Tax=Massilia litorea TaxID=2769491 RepID=A0A7L9U147_9BURK|nr:hypothetical protein [Massilia litorea]QOL48680.1 hypothetical protein LPB04_17175 [Massilia litorea]